MPKRLGRDEWLEKALDVLAQEGRAKLRVDAICQAMNVTKGSFYWHFKDRDDFVRSLVQFWGDRFTQPVIARVTEAGGDSRARLRTLMRFVSEGGYARYDVSIRAWAAQDAQLVADLVRNVDERRLAYVGSIFVEMGFEGVDAEMRARACVAFLIYEAFVLVESTEQHRAMLVDRFLDVIAPEA